MAQRIDYQARTAAGMSALGGAYKYVQRCGLPLTLVNMAFLRASQVNGCAYCIDMHSRELMQQGVAIEKILLIPVWREIDGVFTDRERAVLRWAESVTRVAETAIPDADFDTIKPHFSEQEMADLTLAIGLINVYNRMSIAFRRQPEIRTPGVELPQPS